MDLLSLLTGSENLFKYLFLGGLGMFALAIFYPMNQRYNLQVQKDAYNNEVKLLNWKIDELDSQSKQALSRSNNLVYRFDSLKIHNPKNTIGRNEIKDSANNDYQRIYSNYRETHLDKLAVEYNKVKISTIESHISYFEKYESACNIIGSLSFLGGIIGWFWLMRKGIAKKIE